MSESVRVSVDKSKTPKDDRTSQARTSDYSQPVNPSVDRILFLQRTVGNQAVGRLINSGALQAKLKIGQSDDIYEQSAEAVADLVVRGQSAEGLLGTMAHRGTAGGPVVQCDRPRYIPYSYAPAEITRADDDPARLQDESLTVQDLFALYVIQGRGFHRLPNGATYSYAWVNGGAGTAILRGEIRSRLRTGVNADQRATYQSAISKLHGRTGRIAELRIMVDDAAARTARGETLTAPTLMDVGDQGRTYTPRGRSRIDGADMSDRIHAAMDVDSPSGTGIYAPVAGVVVSSGMIQGFGNVVSLIHEDLPEPYRGRRFQTAYAHLSERLVEDGATVSAGQAIGLVGNTRTDATGSGGRVARGMPAHLHFGLIELFGGAMPRSWSSGGEERYAERRDHIRPDDWLDALRARVAGAPYHTGHAEERDTGTRLLDDVAVVAEQTNAGSVQRWGEHEIDTMRAHHGRSELHRRHGEPDITDGDVVHGGGDVRPPMERLALEEELMQETLRLRMERSSLVPADYVQRILRERATHADISGAFDPIMNTAGSSLFEAQMQAVENGALDLLHTVENHWIHDPEVSGLDILGNDSAQYRDYAWHPLDYPGSPAGGNVSDGPNERRARAMAHDLSDFRPERRANSGDDAIATRNEFEGDANMRAYILAHLAPVPAFTVPPAGSTTIPTQLSGKKLLDTALASFLQMRDAALADGVALIVGAGWRDAATAAHNAAASGNSGAVASYSSHTLGLAVDLDMNVPGVAERDTTPMEDVIAMRSSNVHRWILIRGAAYGWYPYQNEPWHWEYNPPGFRERFLTDAHAPAITIVDADPQE